MKDKDATASFYMNMDAQLKARLRLIARQGKPRRTLTGLINYVMGLYANHILEPIEGLDGFLAEIGARTENFSIDKMMNGGEKDGDDMSP